LYLLTSIISQVESPLIEKHQKNINALQACATNDPMRELSHL